MSLPPGPRLPKALQTYLVWERIVPLMRWCERRYGPIFTLRAFPATHMIFLTRPEDIKAAFAAPADVLMAGKANEILGPVLGRRSVLLSDEDDHATRRKLMLPFFHGRAVQRYAEVVAEIADADLEAWPIGRPFKLHERTQAITLEVILRAVIGVDTEERLARMRLALRRIAELEPAVLLMWIWPVLARFGIWKRQQRWQDEAEAMLLDEIARRRTVPDVESRTDVLSQLVSARYDDGTAMDDEELRDQILTMLLAGHETTATGLAWTFERLTRHPSVMARAQRAAREDDDAYLDAVVSEALRVRPVIADVGRVVMKPFSVGGYDLPIGSTVYPSMLLSHFGSAFGDAAEFRPERFLAGGNPSGFEYFPFGGGRRRCLGAPFASFEMRVVLKRVLLQLELRPETTRDEEQLPRHITLVPKEGCTVVAQRVKAPVETPAAREPQEVA